MRLEVEVRFASWNLFALIYTINISKGGMNIELDSEPPKDGRLLVKLTPPDGRPIELEATVKHAKENGKRWSIGVAFMNLDDARRQSIERTLRAHGMATTTKDIVPRDS